MNGMAVFVLSLIIVLVYDVISQIALRIWSKRGKGFYYLKKINPIVTLAWIAFFIVFFAFNHRLLPFFQKLVLVIFCILMPLANLYKIDSMMKETFNKEKARVISEQKGTGGGSKKKSKKLRKANKLRDYKKK